MPYITVYFEMVTLVIPDDFPSMFLLTSLKFQETVLKFENIDLGLQLKSWQNPKILENSTY